MQLMEAFTYNDGSQISADEIIKLFNSPDTTFIMLGDGDKIAGRNLIEGWKMIADTVAGQSVYCVTISYINRELKFSLDKQALYTYVTERFNKILNES